MSRLLERPETTFKERRRCRCIAYMSSIVNDLGYILSQRLKVEHTKGPSRVAFLKHDSEIACRYDGTSISMEGIKNARASVSSTD